MTCAPFCLLLIFSNKKTVQSLYMYLWYINKCVIKWGPGFMDLTCWHGDDTSHSHSESLFPWMGLCRCSLSSASMFCLWGRSVSSWSTKCFKSKVWLMSGSCALGLLECRPLDEVMLQVGDKLSRRCAPLSAVSSLSATQKFPTVVLALSIWAQKCPYGHPLQTDLIGLL